MIDSPGQRCYNGLASGGCRKRFTHKGERAIGSLSVPQARSAKTCPTPPLPLSSAATTGGPCLRWSKSWELWVNGSVRDCVAVPVEIDGEITCTVVVRTEGSMRHIAGKVVIIVIVMRRRLVEIVATCQRPTDGRIAWWTAPSVES
jgi:hypothetical protein